VGISVLRKERRRVGHPFIYNRSLISLVGEKPIDS
jgi:hypothetical protein